MDKENPLPPQEEQPLNAKMPAAMQNGMHGANGLPSMSHGMHGGVQNYMMQGGMQSAMQNGMMQNGMQSLRGQQLSISPVQGMQRPHNGFHRMYPEGVPSDDNYESRSGNRMGLAQPRSPAFHSNQVPGMRDPANFKNMEFKPASMEMSGPPGQQSSQFYNLQRLRQIQQMQFFERQMGPMGGSTMGGGPMNASMNGPMTPMNASHVSAMGDDPFARMTAYRSQC